MGNILKGLSEILSNGNIIDALTGSQAGILKGINISDITQNDVAASGGVADSQKLFTPQYSNAAPKTVNNNNFTKCTEAIGKTEVENIFSLEFIKEEKIVIDNYKNVLKKRFKMRNAYLADTKFKKSEFESVEKIKALYSELQDYINQNTDEDSAAKSFYTTLNTASEKDSTKTKYEHIKSEIKTEEKILAKITDEGLIDRCRLFREALLGVPKKIGFLDRVRAYTEELTEFHRFDHIYKDDTFQKINNALKTVTFYPSEIKALNCQETADLTDCNIEGVGDFKTKKGLKIEFKKGRKYRGLCQLPNVGTDNSIDEAIKWASENCGITLSKDPSIPQNAIYLTIAYLGRIEEIFTLKTANYLPSDCISLKNIYFSGYNKGIGLFTAAVIEFLYEDDKKRIPMAKLNSNYINLHPPKNGTYDFDKIKEKAYAKIGNDESKIEVKEYIRKIKERLS